MKNKTIGERLQLLRNEYHLTPEKLASLVGVTRVTIDNIEKGVSNPYRSNIEKLADKLGSTYEWLAHGKGEMLPDGKIDVKENTQESNPYKDLLYKELRDQIDFLKETVRSLTGNKGNFRTALSLTGSRRSTKSMAA